MLMNLSKEINEELLEEQSKQEFYDLVHEDHLFNDFIDSHFLNLNESGVSNDMLKNEMPFLFTEDTVVDDELVSNLQNEVDYEDTFNKKPIEDSNDTTNLQEPSDYTDNFSTAYASDADPDVNLNKEVDYNDNQTTPVNIDEFSNEAAEFMMEMGDYSFLAEEFEETIEQAEEGSAQDNRDPVLSDLDGVVMEGDEPSEPSGDQEGLEEDFDQLVEDFLSSALSESDDEDKDDDKCPDCGKDPCECDKDDDKKDKDKGDDDDSDSDSDDDDKDLDECGSNCGDDNPLKESYDIDDWFI